MSQKKYPWKTRYAKLSHRGRREGRTPRNLAAEEHLAREVYDELRANSPHEHIENPCYGLNPKKVRAGQGGSEPYRRTARALLYKTHLSGYLIDGGWHLKTGTELVPLLRKCTAPTDGHIDWPKFVRHVVGLYYITLINPDWLIDNIPFYQSPSFRCCTLAHAMSFYLFRKVPFEHVLRIADEEIFQMVDTKFKHILQNQKDDGDRARWKPCKRDCKPEQDASIANLYRLYGGHPLRKLERDAINEARREGTLKHKSGIPGKENVQYKREARGKRMDRWLVHEVNQTERIENLIKMHQEQMKFANASKDDDKMCKLKRKLASLEKWREKQHPKIAKARICRAAAIRRMEKGNLQFFHGLDTLKEQNSEEVNSYMYLHWHKLETHFDIRDIISQNYDAGFSAKPQPWFPSYTNSYMMPNDSVSLYSVYLLGSVMACRSSIDEKGLTLQEFVDKHREEILRELAGHGVIRHAVLKILRSAENAEKAVVPPALTSGRFLKLLGMDDVQDIEKLGSAYFNKSRELLKGLSEFNTLSLDAIEQARASYHTKHESSGITVIKGYRLLEMFEYEAIPLDWRNTESSEYYRYLATRSFEAEYSS